jgi:hypothetical protein
MMGGLQGSSGCDMRGGLQGSSGCDMRGGLQGSSGDCAADDGDKIYSPGDRLERKKGEDAAEHDVCGIT